MEPGKSLTTRISPPYYRRSTDIDPNCKIYATVSIREPGQYCRELESNMLPLSEVPIHWRYRSKAGGHEG